MKKIKKMLSPVFALTLAAVLAVPSVGLAQSTGTPPGLTNQDDRIEEIRQRIQEHIDEIKERICERFEERGITNLPKFCEEDDDDNGGEDDTTPPVLSNIEADAATTSITVTWDTDEDADSTAYLSTSSPVDTESTSTEVLESDTLETEHELTFSGLATGTQYFMIVASEDEDGNEATSSEVSATTTGEDDNGTTTDETAPVISNIQTDPSTTTAEISWDTDEDADSTAYLSTSSPVDTEATGTIEISDSDLVTLHELLATGLEASTTYFGIVESTDDSDNTATSSEFSFATDAGTTTDGNGTTTDETAPVIENIDGDVTEDSVTVTWDTDEDADSRLWVSTTSPLVPGDPGVISTSSDTLATSHSLTIEGLEASTTYFALLASEDAEGNNATSTLLTFTTDASTTTDGNGTTTDETAPTIENLQVEPGSTTATISWDTDEDATSKVYYSTTTDFEIGDPGVLTVEDLTPTMAHELLLEGLTASTSYEFIAESIDESDNATRTPNTLLQTTP